MKALLSLSFDKSASEVDQFIRLTFPLFQQGKLAEALLEVLVGLAVY